jgi:hypothetical protein
MPALNRRTKNLKIVLKEKKNIIIAEKEPFKKR